MTGQMKLEMSTGNNPRSPLAPITLATISLAPITLATIKLSLVLVAVTLLTTLFSKPAFGQGIAEAPIQNSFQTQDAASKRVQFSFEKADWQDVIPWFAEQTNYSWQPISQFPEGTFTLTSDTRYTPIEALDQLNYALRLQNPPYTIIRNRDQLILTEASSPLPVELIPKVTPEGLDQRGDYEILSCQFRLGDVSIAEAQQDLMLSVNEKYAAFAKILPVSNEFFVRGTGADLKKIRDTIETMTRRKASSFFTYSLLHFDPEQFMIVARRLLRIAPDAYEREDGSLIIVIDPSSNRLIVKGTPNAVAEFKNVAQVVDTPPNVSETGVELSFLKSYPVLTDPATARKVVETMLDGTTATVGQDEITGAIVLRGTQDQHDIAAQTLSTLRGETGTTKIIELENALAADILAAVNSLLNLSSTTATENPNAPKLLANTLQNYIVVRGTPSETFEISQIIDQLDQAQGRDPDRIRTNARVIEMSPTQRDQLLESVEDYWPSTGRKNRLRIIMPDENVKDKLDQDRGTMKPMDSSTQRRQAFPQGSAGLFRNTAWQQPVRSPSVTAMPMADSPPTKRYRPPAGSASVPGAELSIKATPFGVLIESDDLDALDDLEDIFRNQSLDDGTDQGLTIFYLRYKKASSVKPALEKMFGLESGSSSGSGGDLMSGIVDNMAGSGSGDLLGGLLGGSSTSSSAGAIELTGAVQIGLYVPMNLIYVSGATASDLNFIQDAVDLFDQPTAPQNPELAGQFFTIEVLHRDPEEVLDRINTLMADYIAEVQSEESGGGGRGRDDNGISQMANMMRGIAGGGGGGSKDESEDDPPRVRIDLDAETNQILITGPEFIYRQILKLVKAIDTPDLSQPKSYEVLPAEFFSPSAMEILKNTYGKKISVVGSGDEGETEEQGSENANRNGRTENGGNEAQTQNQQRQQQAAEFFRNLRRNGGGGGGQRGGGGQGGGGGQRGGGQRGGGNQRGGR